MNGVASIQSWDFLDFGDYNSECLSDPNLCHHGLSLSFWLRHKRKYRHTLYSLYVDEIKKLCPVLYQNLYHLMVSVVAFYAVDRLQLTSSRLR